MLQLSLASPLEPIWVAYSPSALINGQAIPPFRFLGRMYFPMQRSDGPRLARRPIVLPLVQPQKMMSRKSYVILENLADDQWLNISQVKFVTSQNISFLATGGRHGYTTTYKDLRDGLAIDLSRLNTLDINATAGTLTVGPGVTIGEVIGPLFDAGFDIRELPFPVLGCIPLSRNTNVKQRLAVAPVLV
jgi:hypothetical protein